MVDPLNPVPLSVFLITHNEAARLERTLQALAGLADEIVVVDSGSDDSTLDIARVYGAKIVVNAPFPGYGPQKRLAEDACAHDWVLNVDADEVVCDALREEIAGLLRSGAIHAQDGYRVPIADVLPGERAPGRFAYRLSPVRLYRRSVGRYASSTVHDRVRFPDHARIGAVRHALHHYSIESFGKQIDKLLAYTRLQAQDYAARERPFSRMRLFTEFPVAFGKAYVLRRYALRGLPGFLAAMNYAIFRHMRIVRIFEALRRAARD
jgi:glycosyltransferase involved in cell wall biosynthesis